MGKGLEGWSVRHLLIVSVALNVWLVLKVSNYDKDTNFTTEKIFNGFCAHEEFHKQVPLSSSSSSSSSMAAAAVGEKKSVHDEADDGRIINFDQ